MLSSAMKGVCWGAPAASTAATVQQNGDQIKNLEHE